MTANERSEKERPSRTGRGTSHAINYAVAATSILRRVTRQSLRTSCSCEAAPEIGTTRRRLDSNEDARRRLSELASYHLRACVRRILCESYSSDRLCQAVAEFKMGEFIPLDPRSMAKRIVPVCCWESASIAPGFAVARETTPLPPRTAASHW